MTQIRQSDHRGFGFVTSLTPAVSPSAPVDGIATKDVKPCSALFPDAPQVALGDFVTPLVAAALATDPLAETTECVYFVLAREQRLVKIGWTRNPVDRMRQLRCWSPVDLEWSVALPGGRELERELHEIFADAREHGEWFRVTPQIAWIVLAAVEVLRPHMEIAA